MAKINSPFVGAARGKMGDGVFTVLNGQTIAKGYQPAVYNPRTLGQLDNRVVQASVSKMCSTLSKSKYAPFYKSTNNAFYTGGNNTVRSFFAFLLQQMRRVPVSQYLLTDVGPGNGHAGTQWVVDPDTFLQPLVRTRIYYGNGSLTPPVVGDLQFTQNVAGTLQLRIEYSYNVDAFGAPNPSVTFAYAQLINLSNGEVASFVSDTSIEDDGGVFEPIWEATVLTDQNGQPFGEFEGQSCIVTFGFVEFTESGLANSSRLYPIAGQTSTSTTHFEQINFDPFGEANRVPEGGAAVNTGGLRPSLVGGVALLNAVNARMNAAPAETQVAKRTPKKKD